jgi:hypothetical protein
VVDRTLTRGIGALLLGLLLAALLLPITRGMPNGLIVDDGYYYLQIGYNLGNHFFSSFDGIHPTNGYHLLWGVGLGALAAASSVVSTSKDWFMYVSLALTTTIAAYISLAYFRRTWAQAFVFAFLMWSSSMTEAVILTAFVLYIFDRALHQAGDFLNAPLDRFVVALIPLTRIDATALVGVFGALLFFRDRRKLAMLLACLGAGLVVQLAAMKIAFGEFFSVSSTILWTRSPGLDLHRLSRHLAANLWSMDRNTAAALSVALLVTYCVTGTTPTNDNNSRLGVRAAILANMAFLIPHIIFSEMREWYWTASIVSLFYAASELVIPRPLLQYYSLAACAAIGLEFTVFNTRFSLDRAYTRSFVGFLNQHLPATERILQEDLSGFVGFWAAPVVINGDGMVNSPEYARRMAANQLSGYLEEEGICLIVRDWPLEDDRVLAIGGLTVPVHDVELLLGPPEGIGALPWTQLKLYRLKDQRCVRLADLVPQG